MNGNIGFSPFKVVYLFVPRGTLDLIPLPTKFKVHAKAEDFVQGFSRFMVKVVKIRKKLQQSIRRA